MNIVHDGKEEFPEYGKTDTFLFFFINGKAFASLGTYRKYSISVYFLALSLVIGTHTNPYFRSHL